MRFFSLFGEVLREFSLGKKSCTRHSGLTKKGRRPSRTRGPFYTELYSIQGDVRCLTR